MSDYLDANARYWAGAYDADHVESFIFRMYGRILKFDYGITGANGGRDWTEIREAFVAAGYHVFQSSPPRIHIA